MKREGGFALNVLSKRAESTYLHVAGNDDDLSTERSTVHLLTMIVSMMSFVTCSSVRRNARVNSTRPRG